MELVGHRISFDSLDSLATTRSPSSVGRKNITNTPDRLRSRSSRSLRSTLSSRHDHSQRFEIPPPVTTARIQYLQRVEAVRVQQSTRKHGHRFYVVYVYFHSTTTPIYRRDPSHQIDHAYTSFFALRDTIYESTKQYAEHCETCLMCLAFVSDSRESVYDHLMRRLRPAREKQERLEHFFHSMLRLLLQTGAASGGATGGIPSNIHELTAGVCDGCDLTVAALAKFLQPKYLTSTGII